MNEQLKEDIWSIWKILLDCQENLAFSKYFYKPDTPEEQDYINSSHELKYIRYSLWKLAVIEIHKILSHSKNDEFSLWNLMKNLNSDKYLNHKISEEVLLSWKNRLSAGENTLEKIKFLRNKVYAHTDSRILAKETDITFEEFEKVMAIIESVIRDVHNFAFESAIINETVVFQKDRFDMVKILAKERNDRMNDFLEEAKRFGMK